MRKQRMLGVVGLLVLALLFTGCAQSASSPGLKDMNTMLSTREASGRPPEDASPQEQDEFARKQIRSAQIDAEAEDVEAAYEDILRFARSFNGYESGHTLNHGKEQTWLTAVVRITPEHLDELLAYIGEVARIRSSGLTTEDVTEAYFDTQTRLRTMEASLDTYYGFLAAAKNLDESLAVQERINDLTAEIESFKGRIRLWDSLLDEATVSIRLYETGGSIATRTDIDWRALSWADMGYLIRSGLTRVGNVIVGGLQWLAIVIVAGSPVWVVGGVLWLVLHRRAKKRKQNRASAPVPMATHGPAVDVPPGEEHRD